MLDDFPSTHGQERENLILDIVKNQPNRLSYDWSTLKTECHGHDATLWVMSDALKIDGIRVNVTAHTLQLIADHWAAMLMTAKIADLIWHNAEVRLEPRPRSITSSTQAMIDHSKDIDKQLKGVDHEGKLLSTVGKYWIIDSVMTKPRYPNNQAVNYGWHFKGNSFQGINGGTNASLMKDPVSGMYWRMIQTIGSHHDSSHVDYCVSPDTKILKSDLTWVNANKVTINDSLIGFDEKLNNAKFRYAQVEQVSKLKQPCYEIVTDKTTVISSSLHRWPTRFGEKITRVGYANGKKWTNVGRRCGWVKTENLKIGDQIPFIGNTWEHDISYDGAWMSGIFDGEGWISDTSCGVAQNDGIVFDKIIQILDKHQFDYSITNNNGCNKIHIKGRASGMRVLGTFRPIRLMLKQEQTWLNRDAKHAGRFKAPELYAKILGIKYIGEQDVVGIQTSTNTFIANGLLSHNSQVARLVSRQCVVDGRVRDLAEILKDPELSWLVSHSGPQPIVRQPGVPEPNVIFVPGSIITSDE